MATTVGQAVGFQFGGPVGGAIGAVAGAFIDSYITREFFPEEDVEGDRLDSLQFSGASEGRPRNVCFGPGIKVAATCIWQSPVRETMVEAGGGLFGKGGGETTSNIVYRSDMAWEFAETSLNTGGAIDGVEKIFMDGNLVWIGANSGDTGVQTDLSVTVVTVTINGFVFVYQQINSPIGGQPLGPDGMFFSGRDCVITGFTASSGANNGTFRCVKSVTNDDGSSFLWVINPNAVTEAAGPSARVQQSNPSFSTALADNFRFYDGDQDLPDAVDPLIAAEETDIPHFRQSAYFTVENLDFTAFGNRAPSSVEVIVRADASPFTRAATFDRILGAAGLVSGTDFDTSGISGNLNGYVIRGPRTIGSALAQLMLAYDIFVQDRDGVLTFFDRDQADQITINSDDLAAHERGSDSAPRDVRLKDNQFRKIPESTTVDYVDLDAEYQAGSQVFRRVGAKSSTGQRTKLRMDLALSAAEAQCVARRVMFQRIIESLGSNVSLPPSYLKVVESDLLLVTADDGQQRELWAHTVDQGVNYLRQYEGVTTDVAVREFSVADCIVEDPSTPIQGIQLPTELSVAIMDIAPLRDNQTQTGGFYWATSPFGENQGFVGASLFESMDDGTTFSRIGATDLQSTMGYATTTLAAPVTAAVIDEVNTVNVVTYTNSLASATESEVLSGANRILLGDEILGFIDVVQEVDGSFTLSRLLRGLRDTDDQMSTHTSSDAFIWLNAIGVNFSDRPITHLNQVRDFRSVPAGGLLGDFSTQADDITINFNCLRPFAPTDVVGVIDGSDNWIFTWQRRTRAIYNAMSGNPMPQLEPARLYEIDIMDGATVVRTISVTDAETATYTEAQQDADFVPATPITPLTIRLFQVSTVVGRSKVEEVTLTG